MSYKMIKGSVFVLLVMVLFSVSVEKQNKTAAKSALQRIKNKIPCKCRVLERV